MTWTKVKDCTKINGDIQRENSMQNATWSTAMSIHAEKASNKYFFPPIVASPAVVMPSSLQTVVVEDVAGFLRRKNTKAAPYDS